MARIERFIIATVAIVLPLAGGCSFSPNVPNGHIICRSGSECPSGYTCEDVTGAETAYKVCCKDKGCGGRINATAPVDGARSDATGDVSSLRDGQMDVPDTGAKSDGQAGDAPPPTSDTVPGGETDHADTTLVSDGPPGPDLPTDEPMLPDGPGRDAPSKLDGPSPDVVLVILPDAHPDLYVPDAYVPDAYVPDVYVPDVYTPDGPLTCSSDQDCPTTDPTCIAHACVKCTLDTQCTGNPKGTLCDTSSGRCASCLSNADCTVTPSKPYCGNGICTACPYATTTNGCCADSDCTLGGPNTIGQCDTSAHACSYPCDSTHTMCGNVCILKSGCCQDSECTNLPANTVGKCEQNTCSYPCANGYRTCNGSTVCTPQSSCCSDLDCNAGNTCNGGTCVPITGCNGNTPTLGCACPTSADVKCNGSHQKVRLICAASTTGQPGLAWKVLDTCSSATPGYNCDTRDATCQPILAGCANQNPGFAYCASSGSPLYMDLVNVCGPDLVTNASSTQCSGICQGGSCQAATCGDHKVQTDEECDDGNTTPLDGCEPSTCVRSGVVKLAVGDGHTCALCKGGRVRCWGENTGGQLGLGHTNFVGDKNPYQITDASGNTGMVNLGGVAATDISAGYGFTCALLTGGSVRCWGANDTGQLGLGNTTPIPTQVGSAINFGSGLTATAISAGWGYACAVLSNGTVRCWGDNSVGLLGLGNTNAVLSGTVALGSVTAVGVAAGGSHACALLTGGLVHCWGDNYFGEFGIGTQTPMDSTATLPSAYGNASLKSGRTVATLGVGSSLNCARLDDGEVECWGYNNVGQLGLGNTATIGDNEVPGSVGLVSTGATAVAQVAVGSIHACALYANGAGLKCWGSNGKGQLGYGDTANRGNTNATIPASLQPISLPNGLTATAAYAGTAHTCAVLSDGSVRCWGWNDRGQLGLAKVSGTQVGTPDYIGGASNETPSQLAAVQIFPP